MAVSSSGGKKRDHDQDPADDAVKKSKAGDVSKYSGAERYEHWKKQTMLTVMERTGKKHLKPHAIKKFLRQKQNPELEEVNTKAKELWEELRRQDLSKKKREKVADELLLLIKGKETHLATMHDSSRVLQSLIKHGTEAQVAELFDALKGKFETIILTKHGRFLVEKIMTGNRTKPSQKDFVFKLIADKSMKFLCHNFASNIVEAIYSDFCKLTQRNAILAQVYGTAFQLHRSDTAATLDATLKSGEVKTKIMAEFGRNLSRIVKKCSIRHSIVHKLLFDFFTNDSKEVVGSEHESISRRLCPSELIHLCHTSDGVKVAVLLLTNATIEDRSAVIATLRTHIVRIVSDQFGYLFLVAICHFMLDKILLKKAIMKEIVGEGEKLFNMQSVTKFFLYLANPSIWCIKYGNIFRFTEIDFPSDQNASLFDLISNKLIRFYSNPDIGDKEDDDGQMAFFSSNPIHFMLFEQLCLTERKNDPAALLERLAKCLAMKQLDLTNQRVSLLVRSLIKSSEYFAKQLSERIMEDQTIIEHFLGSNRGCFMLLQLIESNNDNVEEMAKMVNKSINDSAAPTDRPIGFEKLKEKVSITCCGESNKKSKLAKIKN